MISACNKEELIINNFKIDSKYQILKPHDIDTLTVLTGPVEYDHQNIIWESKNPEIVSVSNSGIINAIKPGVASIIASTYDDIASDTCSVTVVNIINYSTSDGLLSNFVSAFAIDSMGNQWFGTSKGVSKFDGTK